MIIVNEATCGAKTYIVSIGTNPFKVTAYDEQSAINLVADYIENHKWTNLYYGNFELKVMAECSKWKTADVFAEAHNLTCCGNHKIYIELLNIEEVSE